MNERIGQLAEQAGLLGPSSRVGDAHAATERFAELIVQECIKLNGKELAMAGHSRMVDVYCEHFGIDF
jgi:hypothetical protein